MRILNIFQEPENVIDRATFRRNQPKAKRFIFGSVKDLVMSVMTTDMTPKECMDSLTQLYERTSTNQKRYLKHKLKFLKMEKGESVGEFCLKIKQIRDRLVVLKVKVDDDDLVQAIYDGLPASENIFLSSVNGRKEEPSFETLWHDCIEEESRNMVRQASSKDEAHALVAAFRKRGRRPSFKKSNAPPRLHPREGPKETFKPQFKGKSFDSSKFRCFKCNKIGHMAKDCRSKGKTINNK